MRIACACLLTLVGLVGCTHSVHQVAMGGLDEIPPGARAHPVVADAADQNVVLYITDNTDNADQAYATLLAQCPGGELRAVEARSSTSNGFLSFTNHLRLSALCVQ